MIQKFVDRFMSRRKEIEDKFRRQHPCDYMDVVKNVIACITSDEYDDIDPERIHLIDDGHYQGTLLFVIAEKGYQPSNYWLVKIDYGSCSGCDTLQRIRNYGDEPPTESQVSEYMQLCLHIVQKLKNVGDS